MSVHPATISWDGSRDDLRAHSVRVKGQEFAGSCAPDRGGDSAKTDPEQLLVAALSCCHMLWFLDFSRRERLRVATYVDEAEGTLEGDCMIGVTLRPRVEFQDRDPRPNVVAELHHRAHEACFIANSVNFPVVVE